MRLKLLAPFRTGFDIVSELPIRDPVNYMQFWEEVVTHKEDLRIILPHDLSLSSDVHEIRFPHRYRLNTNNRYRSLDSDSLERTIHVLEMDFDEIPFMKDDLPADGSELIQALVGNLTFCCCRVYDHGISLLEMDFDLEDWLQTKPAADVFDYLDVLQDAGVQLGEILAHWYHENLLQPLFGWIVDVHPESEKFIEIRDEDGGKIANGDVLWVTRTLIFEEWESANREQIIRHWLKDSGGNEVVDGHTLIDEIVAENDQHLTHWLNYLFREGAYHSLDTKRDEQSRCVRAFCDEWEGMLYAQYFYAALDVVDLHLTNILAFTLSDGVDIKIDRQKVLLANNIRKTNLLLIQLHDSSKYYKRTVKAELDDILAYWDFAEVLVNPVQNKIGLCQERLNQLHQQEAAKSAIYTDMILLGIGVTAIFGTFIALAEYGRTMANDVNLASYDVNSPNFVDWFATQPTDVILVVSSLLSLLLVVIYFYYRKIQIS